MFLWLGGTLLWKISTKSVWILFFFVFLRLWIWSQNFWTRSEWLRLIDWIILQACKSKKASSVVVQKRWNSDYWFWFFVLKRFINKGTRKASLLEHVNFSMRTSPSIINLKENIHIQYTLVDFSSTSPNIIQIPANSCRSSVLQMWCALRQEDDFPIFASNLVSSIKLWRPSRGSQHLLPGTDYFYHASSSGIPRFPPLNPSRGANSRWPSHVVIDVTHGWTTCQSADRRQSEHMWRA